MSINYQLSDPWGDFISPDSQTLLNRIIKKWGRNLTAEDLMIIFDPFLPAGTVKENVNYLSLGFDFLDKYVDQFEENDTSDGIYDFWTGLCRWSYVYKNELIELNQYDLILKRAKQFIEAILRFRWDLTQEVGLLFYSAQFLVDTIGQDLLKDISPDYPRYILGNFKNNNDRDCAISLYLFQECHNKCNEIWKEASLVKSIYSKKMLNNNWDMLYARWLDLGEVSTPSYCISVEKYIIDSVDRILSGKSI